MSLPGWPEYWYGMPPMHYATHAVGPLLQLASARAESVVCFGSGRIRDEYVERYGSPFAVESALVKLKDSDLACEVTRSLFDTIRQYRESFDVYGTERSFEWEQTIGQKPVIYSGFEDAERVEVPDYGKLLPKEIAGFTQRRRVRRGARAHVVHPGGRPRRLASAPRARVRERHPRQARRRPWMRRPPPTGR